jgi:hypothetical protein
LPARSNHANCVIAFDVPPQYVTTPAEAEKFIADAEKRLFDLNVKYSRAD